jgi:hypothetical protein
VNFDTLKQNSPLEWAFLWNQARLLIAGATLVLAKQSPILTYLSIPVITPLAGTFMSIAWLISGLVAGYLIWHWYHSERTYFGGKETIDQVAFWVATITGVHLGIAAIFTNIGFALTPDFLSTPVMIATGLLYFWSAYHLHKRGGAKALFAETTPTTPSQGHTSPQQPSLTETKNQG